MSIMKWILERVVKRLPENRISFKGDVYLRRFYLLGKCPPALREYFAHGPAVEERFAFLPFTVYLHCFERPDKDRDLHNHPWNATGLVLTDGYVEERYTEHPSKSTAERVYRRVKRWGFNHINADDYHRVDALGSPSTWTLFMVGDKVQSWGFWDEEKGEHVNHRDYAESGEKSKRHHEPKNKGA